jgi:hypothetical protein
MKELLLKGGSSFFYYFLSIIDRSFFISRKDLPACLPAHAHGQAQWID